MKKIYAVAAAFVLVIAGAYFYFNPFTETTKFSLASEVDTPPLEQIGKGVPVFAAHSQANVGRLNDNNFDTTWESGSVPTWVAFNLNSVPAEKKQKILVSWANQAYGHRMGPGWQDKVPASYVIQGSASTGTNVPTDWTTLSTTSGNPYASRQHVVQFSGYNWVRINITGTNGTQSIQLPELNVFNATPGVADSFLFLGDSITADWMRQWSINGKVVLAQLVAQKTNGAHYPVTEQAGYPGYSTYGVVPNMDDILGAFPGRFVVVLLGANDSGSDFRLNDNLSDGTSFRPNYRKIVEKIIAAGKIPILTYITGSTNSGRATATAKYNDAIRQIASEYPEAILGPDLYSLTMNNTSYISSDTLHMSAAGNAAIREAFANWISQNIYGGTVNVPSPVVTTPTSIPQPTSPPPITAAPLPTTGAQVLFNVEPANVIRPFTKENRSFSVASWDMEKVVLYDGDISPRTSGLKYLGEVQNLDTVVKLMGAGIVRYSGGGWTNFVGWDRSGTKVSRVKWTDSYNGVNNEYTYRYVPAELDSLAQFVQKAEMDVMIEVNVYKEDPEMWADMVRYTNIEKGYKFKYWELGNENDLGSHQLTTAEYAKRAIAYARAMKAVDPSIQIVAGVPALSSDGTASGMSPYLEETAKAFRNAGETLDVLSWHWYPGDGISTVQSVYQYAPKSNGQPLPPRDWRERLFGRRFAESGPTNTRTYILNNMPNTKIALTELNVECCDYTNNVNINHFSGLWFSDILGRHAYYGADQQFMWLGYGAYEYSTIRHDGNGNLTKLQSPYYVMVMYNKFFGDQLVQTSFPDNDRITVWASTRASDPSKLYLMVTNLSSTPITSKINVGSFVAKSGQKYTLTSYKTPDVVKEFTPTPTPAPTLVLSESPNTRVDSKLNGVVLDPNNIVDSFNSIPAVQLAVNGNSVTDTFAPLTATSIVLSRDASAPVPTAIPTTVPTVLPTATRTPTPTKTPTTAPGLPTATKAPTAVPTVKPTNVPLPTTPPVVTVIPSGDVKGIELGGNTVTVDGIVFQSATNNPSVSVIGNTYNNSWMTLSPAPATSAMKSMISTGLWGGGESPKVSVSNIENATYDVILYVMEDDSPQTFGVTIEGRTEASNISTGAAKTWQRVGPFRVNVADNALNLNTFGGAVLLSAITYEKVGTSAPTAAPTPTKVPAPTFSLPSPTSIIATITRFLSPTSRPSNTSTPTAVPTVGSNGSELVVVASGDPGGSVNPLIEILVNGQKVRPEPFAITARADRNETQSIIYRTNTPLTAKMIRVRFINDGKGGSDDINVKIDKIILNGTEYQTESSTVLSTGTFYPNSCSRGNKKQEWLHCNGYFQYQ